MTSQVRFEVEGTVGRIILDRPEAINALNLAMCQAMLDRLAAWESDDAITLVIVEHAGARGFCAGGDVRALVADGPGDGGYARSFFQTEYRLNHLMFTFAKPILAFMDGITMGGGVGISAPARWRVATEHTVWAMPETSLGLFNDVGTGHYLSRLPGALGAFIVLIAARLDGAECRSIGLATHYLRSGSLDDVKAAIVAAPGNVQAILDSAEVAPPPARIDGNREKIDRLFCHPRYEDILAALAADPSAWAAGVLAMLRPKAPSSCKVVIRLLREAARIDDFAQEMALEYAVATRMALAPDFHEGVNAVLVAKHNRPRWRPPTPESMTDSMVDALFAPLPKGQAWTPYR
jgi:enoyl-CoA hydratase